MWPTFDGPPICVPRLTTGGFAKRRVDALIQGSYRFGVALVIYIAMKPSRIGGLIVGKHSLHRHKRHYHTSTLWSCLLG